MKLKLLLCGLIVLSACASKEQKAIETKLLEIIKSPSSYNLLSFNQYKTETLGEQYDLEIYSAQTFCDMRKKIVDELEADLNSPYRSMRDFAKEQLKEHKPKYLNVAKKLQYLKESLDANIKDTSKVVLRYYHLVYEAKNTFGVALRDTCSAAIDNNGDITLIRYMTSGDLVRLKNEIAIPYYYDFEPTY